MLPQPLDLAEFDDRDFVITSYSIHYTKLYDVKKISCSPWSNRDNFAEKLNKNIIMSNKPTPSYLAQSQVDFDIVKKDIQYTCEVARKNNIAVELILKDISTVKHDPKRLTKWAEVAMRVVEGF